MSLNKAKSEAMTRIAKVSRWAEIVSTLGIIAAVLSVFYVCYLLAIGSPEIDRIIQEELNPGGGPVTLNVWSRSAAYLLELVVILIGLYIFDQARRLFRGYRAGKILTFKGSKRIQTIGWLVFSLAPVSIVTASLSKLVITLGNVPGARSFSIGIDDTDVYAIILGLLLVTIGKILHEAALISDEYKGFI